MDIRGKVALVTGGGGGIGRALASALAERGARGVAVADLDGDSATRVAEEIGGLGLPVDVSSELELVAAIDRTEHELGPIDLMVSNAGILFSDAPGWTATSQTNEQWQRVFDVNVMAHVWAARALVPRMVARGGGTFLHTVSAAGLLNQIGDAAYSMSKHAALGFAEALQITHGHEGIRVSVLCPQAVNTAMYRAGDHDRAAEAASMDGVLEPEDVVETALAGLAEDRFLILPHPRVQKYFENKAADYDRWLAAMQGIRARLFAESD